MELELTKLEYRLLLLFMRNVGKLITMEQLKNEIWNLARGYTEYITDETARQNIKRLRSKIEEGVTESYVKEEARRTGLAESGDTIYRVEPQR